MSFRLIAPVFAFLLAVFLVPATGMTQPVGDERYVQLEILPETATPKAGEPFTVAIRQEIAPHWHTYWLNPGDSGEALEINWELPEGWLASDEMLFPVPQIYFTGPLASYGYAEEAILLQDITPPADWDGAPVQVVGDIVVLVCKDICIPEFEKVTVTFGDPAYEVDAGLFERARNALPKAFDHTATYHEQNGRLFLDVSGADMPFPDAGVTLITRDWGIVAVPERTRVEVWQDGLIRLSHARGERPLDQLEQISGLLTFTDSAGALQGYEFTATPDLSDDAIVVPNAVAGGGSAGEPPSLVVALLFALIGGLILNLMPCVFPVLSLKALKIARISGKELRLTRLNSFAYTLGILVSFWVFALVILVLKAGGQEIGWGFQLQNPAFVLILTWLLFVIGLNLSGFFEIGARFGNIGSRLTQSDSLSGSFFTGVLAALVATPCTAPFMATALGFALTQPFIVTLVVFTALGLGLALPFLLMAVFPAVSRALPKPGAWMDTFKQFLAFPLYASSVWLLWVYVQQTGSIGLILALGAAVMIVFTLWLWRVTAPPTGAMRKIARVVTLIVLLPCLILPVTRPAQISAGQGSVAASQGGLTWHGFTPESYNAALATDQPVFVDMTADWCITCKVNERVALSSRVVKDTFAEENVFLLKGDWTNYDPQITNYLERYGRSGVPLYVYYGRPNENGERPEAVVLPQLLTPGMVTKTLQNTP